MQFYKVCLEVETNSTTKSRVICFEHEIPIYQVRFGDQSIEQVEDNIGRDGLSVDAKGEPIDYDLMDEWNRLMENPPMVDEGDNKMPAPLVAFPRRELDLEDFYARLRRPEAAEKPKASVADIAGEQSSSPKGLPTPKEQRAAAKARLDELGIEYKGNASTDSLLELLNEVDNADVQNEG